MKQFALEVSIVAMLCMLAPSLPSQLTFQESEPNDQKSQATAPVFMRDGDQIAGSLQPGPHPNDSDYWLIRTAPAAPGVYEHVLQHIVGDRSASFSLRGFTQTGGAINGASDIPVSVHGARALRWYGFGQSEKIYFKAFGRLGDYRFKLITKPVTPGVLPEPLAAGPIAIHVPSSGGDTDLWVYDTSLQPLRGYGNDDAPLGGREPTLGRTFSVDPGVYLLAVAAGDLANDQPSPADDGNRNGDVLEFAGAVLCTHARPVGVPNAVEFTHGDPPRKTGISAPLLSVGFLVFEVVPPNAIPAAFARGSTRPVQQGATAPVVAATSQDLYVGMQRDVPGSKEIAVRHSSDGGATLAPAVGIPGSTLGFDPHAAAAGSDVHVGFAKPGTGSTFEVVMARSTDRGRSWNSVTLATGGFSLGAPDVAITGVTDIATVLAAFHVQGSGTPPRHDVVVRESRDGGATYQPPVVLSPPGTDARSASIDAHGNHVYVTWVEHRPTPSIRGRASRDGGASWAAVQTVALLNGPPANAFPELVVTPGGTVAVTWVDDPPGDTTADVFLSQSSGGGAFAAPANVSRSVGRLSLAPSILHQHSLLHVFWSELSGSAGEAFHASVAIGSSLPPSLPSIVSGSPNTLSSLPGAAVVGDFLAMAVAEFGAASSDVVLHTTRALPWHALVGSGGCAGEFGAAAWSVQGDQTSPHTLTVGPVAPGAVGVLALSSRLAATPLRLVGSCELELDLSGLVVVPVVANAFGSFSFRTRPLPPGTILGQTVFLDGPQITLSAVVELRN